MVCLTVRYRIDEVQRGLLTVACWVGMHTLAVDGDQSVVELVEVGEYGASASRFQGWPIQCFQHVIQA